MVQSERKAAEDRSPWGPSTAHRVPPAPSLPFPTLDEEVKGPQRDRVTKKSHS